MVFNALFDGMTGFWLWFWWMFMIALGLFFIVFIILTLIHQAKNKKWVFFILTLVLLFFGLGILVALIYWIIWIFSSSFRRGN